jgi:L-fucose isomerase-like protein
VFLVVFKFEFIGVLSSVGGVVLKRVLVAGFATRLHGEGYYESVYSVFKRYISRLGVDVVFLDPITSLEDARRAGAESRDSIPVLVALTGGTSGFIQEFTRSGEHQRVVLIGHGEHNSLASAISARARLDFNGVWTWIFHCTEPESTECAVTVNKAMRVVRAVSRLLGSRILVVSETREKSSYISDFEERFEARVDVISTDALTSRLEEADLKLVEEFYRILDKYEFTVSRDLLSSVVRFYSVVKSLVEQGGYSGVAIDCFPYLVKYRVTPCLALAVLNAMGVVAACESDLASLALMIISRELTGYTGWIANSTVFTGNRALFSHCTVAVNMIKRGKVVSHFESGYPYALSGELVDNVYTYVSMSRDYSVIVADTGKLVASGLLYKNMCRTQSILETEFNAEIIPLYAPANHHVLIPGDVREELRAIAGLLGLDYLEYRELGTTLK